MYHVLIMDDEAPARIAIIRLGHWADYGIADFQEVTNAEDALKIMRKQAPHIVFVDMQMPGMNGIDFLKIASAEFPQTKYIVCSGYDYFSYARDALKCGAIDYLLKPIARDELNAAIDKAVSSLPPETEMSPAEAPEAKRLSPEEVAHLIHRDIDHHYNESLKISSYAEKYYFTKEYLSRTFQKRYQISISEYLLQVRMEHARQLLSDPTLQIQTIAERVGYRDNNYFSKAFRGYYGVSPKDYRRAGSCQEM